MTFYDGTGNPVDLYYMTEDGPKPVQRAVRAGDIGHDPEPDHLFRDVDHMLATPGFTWAHRGGSIYKPEMSIAAYDHAADRGYAVLEVSFGRTSDGVWVGLHDNDLNRTTKTTGLPPIIDMTWADVQQHLNHTGQVDSPQPYTRWEDIRDKYGQTHILVMDPKNYNWGTYLTEFLGMCEEIGPQRCIVKQYGTDINLANEAAHRGFYAWGFFYEDMLGHPNHGDRVAAWSLLGMELIAPQAAWDMMLSAGKPVVGHIASTQAAYDTAIAKGASGVQCSGTHVITPVNALTPL